MVTALGRKSWYVLLYSLGFFFIGTIRIKQKGQGIALYAPSHGLQEVYYDTDQWKVRQNVTDQYMGTLNET